MSNDNKKSPNNQVRRCPVCGEPIFSRARVHPECSLRESSADKRKTQSPPQKKCQQCDHKTHVRTLACPQCGTMF